MQNWLTPKKAAEYLRNQNPETAFGETTIRTLLKQGFPHIRIGSRCLLNMDSFGEDLQRYCEEHLSVNN